ncbi:MAG: exonuclease domain-containing protein [Candidatus Omnitrophota bacterium]
MHNEEYIIFDVETTGLSPALGDRVIEIAALKVKNFRPIEKFHSLVDPQREISYGAFLVNGIMQEMLDGAPLAKDVFPRFLEFAGSRCLVGHNIGFDLSFLNQELSLLGQKAVVSNAAIDTLKMARSLLPSLGSYSLWMVAQALGVGQKQRHRALEDVYMTFEVFERLMRCAKEKSLATPKTLLMLFGRTGAAHQAEIEEKMALIEEAIEENKDLQLSYFSAGRVSITSRKVTPKKLTKGRSRATLVGYCYLREQEREFRIDRILQLQKL